MTTTGWFNTSGTGDAGTLAKQILPRILAERVQMGARPVPILLQLVNQYSIAGLSAAKLRLNRWSDHGAATTATEGVAFSTVTTLSMGTEIDLEPSEAAVMLAQITDGAVEKSGLGYANALELFQSGDLAAQLSVLEPEAMNLAAGCAEKLEKDLAALLEGFSNSVGAVTAACAIADLEAAIFTSDTLEQPHTDRVFVLSPKAVSDIRKELMVTSGGVAGQMWGNQAAPYAANVPAGQVGEIWYPIFQMSNSVVKTTTVSGQTGYSNGLILRGSGNPEQAGGSGQVGAIAFCEGRPLTFATDLVLRSRALDLIAIHKYAVAERADDFGVRILCNDA